MSINIQTTNVSRASHQILKEKTDNKLLKYKKDEAQPPANEKKKYNYFSYTLLNTILQKQREQEYSRWVLVYGGQQ